MKFLFKNEINVWIVSLGTWCSGIIPALQAVGPEFDPRCIHFFSNYLLIYNFFNFTLNHLVMNA